MCHIHTIDQNFAGIHTEHTGNGIEHGGLTGTIAADDGDKIAFLQVEIQSLQSNLFIDRSGIEGLVDIFNFKHDDLPFSSGGSTPVSSKELPGTRLRSMRRTASDSWC